MGRAEEKPFTRFNSQAKAFWMTIKDVGRAVLGGKRDWLSLQPPARWIGGIEIKPGLNHWVGSTPTYAVRPVRSARSICSGVR